MGSIQRIIAVTTMQMTTALSYLREKLRIIFLLGRHCLTLRTSFQLHLMSSFLALVERISQLLNDFHISRFSWKKIIVCFLYIVYELTIVSREFEVLKMCSQHRDNLNYTNSISLIPYSSLF